MRILDYGAGWKAYHARVLKSQGINVTAYDFGRNFDPNLHDEQALGSTYDVVYASNVINVQSTTHALARTFAELAYATEPKGFAYFNYPKSPRKLDLTIGAIRMIAFGFFKYVFEVREGVWRCASPHAFEAGHYVRNKMDFTKEEIAAANVRPSGVIGRRAIVPRYVAEVHCKFRLFV